MLNTSSQTIRCSVVRTRQRFVVARSESLLSGRHILACVPRMILKLRTRFNLGSALSRIRLLRADLGEPAMFVFLAWRHGISIAKVVRSIAVR